MYFFKILNDDEIKTCTEKIKDYHAFKDGKLRGKVLQLTFYQAKMEQAQETDNYEMNITYKKRIKNFYK